MSCIFHRTTKVSQTLSDVQVIDMGHGLSIDGVGVILGTGIGYMQRWPSSTGVGQYHVTRRHA